LSGCGHHFEHSNVGTPHLLYDQAMAEREDDVTKTAFALAGLGGFNAHGAGFLTAARDCKVKPTLITATSGQIVVLADWLQGKDVKKALKRTTRNSDWPIPNRMTLC
jgi:hypothetical protein